MVAVVLAFSQVVTIVLVSPCVVAIVTISSSTIQSLLIIIELLNIFLTLGTVRDEEPVAFSHVQHLALLTCNIILDQQQVGGWTEQGLWRQLQFYRLVDRVRDST